MESIRVIRDISELEGTAYIELLPGSYNNKCWNEGSIFFEEEVFGCLEPIISRHVPSYDHYAFTEIAASKWTAIIKDFQMLEYALEPSTSLSELAETIGFAYFGAQECFADDFIGNKSALRHLLQEVVIWVTTEASRHGKITILGL